MSDDYVKAMRAFRNGAEEGSNKHSALVEPSRRTPKRQSKTAMVVNQSNPIRVDPTYRKSPALQRDLTRYYETCIVSSSVKRFPNTRRRKSYCAAAAWKIAKKTGRYSDYPTFTENGITERSNMAKKKPHRPRNAKGHFIKKRSAAKRPKRAHSAPAAKRRRGRTSAHAAPRRQARPRARARSRAREVIREVIREVPAKESTMASENPRRRRRRRTTRRAREVTVQANPRRRRRRARAREVIVRENPRRVLTHVIAPIPGPHKARSKAKAKPAAVKPKRRKSRGRKRTYRVAATARPRRSIAGHRPSMPTTMKVTLQMPKTVRRKGKKGAPRRSKKASESLALYENPAFMGGGEYGMLENPMTGGELALIFVAGGAGVLITDLVDRLIVVATNKAAATSGKDKAADYKPQRIDGPPGLFRILWGVASTAAPLAGAAFVKQPLVRASLAGIGVGSGIRFVYQMAKTYLLAKALKDNATGKQLYPAEIAALAGPPHYPNGLGYAQGPGYVGQPSFPNLGFHDPGPRAGLGLVNADGTLVPDVAMMPTYGTTVPVSNSPPTQGPCGPCEPCPAGPMENGTQDTLSNVKEQSQIASASTPWEKVKDTADAAQKEICQLQGGPTDGGVSFNRMFPDD